MIYFFQILIYCNKEKNYIFNHYLFCPIYTVCTSFETCKFSELRDSALKCEAIAGPSYICGKGKLNNLCKKGLKLNIF